MARVDLDEAGIAELRFAAAGADLDRRAERVLADQVANCPVLTGRLRGSLAIERTIAADGSPVRRIGSNLSYACILGSRASVITSEGARTIGQIQPGERVLTQTGEFREVLAKSAFPATEKPDMVEITVPWRAGQDHVLNVTVDHKVLVLRDGRNQWVQAGDLLMTDGFYVRRKRSDRKGAGGRLHVCLSCGQQFRRVGTAERSYCSTRCRDVAWAGSANPHRGRKRTEATKALLRQITADRLAAHPEQHPSRIVASRGRMTTCEATVATWLTTRGVAFERQRPVGTGVVDFFLPGCGTVIEADGAYWHRDQAKDVARDARIRADLPDAEILHLHFFDPRFSPTLDPNPLSGVHYVPCNPGPASFTDPRLFKAVTSVSVRHWRFEARGSKPKMLYDLAVDTVHSFFANGILVSNSHVEQGTGLFGPHHQVIVPTTKQALYWPGARHPVASVKGQRAQPFIAPSLAAAID